MAGTTCLQHLLPCRVNYHSSSPSVNLSCHFQVQGSAGPSLEHNPLGCCPTSLAISASVHMVSSWHSGAARGMRLRCAGLGSSACRLPLPLAALLLAAVALLPIVACATAADTPTPKLSDAALHKILYEEPNAYLQALGNVGSTQWCWRGARGALLAYAALCCRPLLGGNRSCHDILHTPLISLFLLWFRPAYASQISDTEGSLSRIFLSPAHRRAAGKVRGR